MSGTLPSQFKANHNNNNESGSEDDDEEVAEEEEEEEDRLKKRDEGEDDEDEEDGGRTSSSKSNLMTKSGTGIVSGGSAAPPSTSVRVALRIRPLLPREVIANARECISVTPNEPQVWIAGTHAFTYDHVFKTDAPQDDIFCNVAKPLVDGILEGYNATILAYGQTGSGKTYTMGTGFDPEVTTTATTAPPTLGLLPRCIAYLFEQIHERTVKTSPPPDFKISVQFTELYNEEVIDLLSDTPSFTSSSSSSSSRPNSASQKSSVRIHEDAQGQIYLVNIHTKPVGSAGDTLEALKNGALNRTTASTNMNDSSSRSHAIFSIMVTQNRVVREKSGATDIETLSAKFHFVDLAGSERLKRTLATGDRAREGIAINSGLLALGNVISALGDKSKKSTHVPYRDSKLTRLLQDSLGGNSRTLMIACVSPNELDFVETLNTMKYANRAKNIRNKVVVNQDKSSRTISLLKEEIANLNAELLEYKRGSRKPELERECDVNAENIMLLAEVDTLKSKLKAKQDTIDKLTSQLARLQAITIADEASSGCDLTNMVSKYLCEIEDLRAKLYESESECEKLRAKQRQIIKNLSSPRESGGGGHVVMETESVASLLSKAKEEVQSEQSRVKGARKVKEVPADDEDASSSEEEEEDDDEEEEDDEDEDSSGSGDPNASNYTELANLTQEINTKQRLIEELENSQLRLESLKQKYEEKLGQLANKIKSTEEERDAVLKNKSAAGRGQKQIEYEAKIKELQNELKKWNTAKKEHAKMIRNQTNYEAQIGKLRREVEEMKKLKVKLMNQVKNENLRHRELEKQRMKEITQLKKESRKHEIRVRKLESDSKLKEVVLKRKLAEVEMLKKNRANNPGRMRGGVGGGGGGSRASPVKGKQVWSRIQSNLHKDVSSRFNVAGLEKDMVGLISRRSDLNQMLKGETDVEEIDSIESNLRLVEEKIRVVQEEILLSNQLGEEDSSRGNNGGRSRSSSAVQNCGGSGVRAGIGDVVLGGADFAYVLEKLYEQSLSSLSEVAALEGRLRETEEVNKHLQRDVETVRELFHHMYVRKLNGDPSPPEAMLMPPPPAPPPVAAQIQAPGAPKARRRLTATTQELLGASTESLELLSDVQPPNNLANRTFTRGNRLTQSMRAGGSGNNMTNNKVPVKRTLTRQDTYAVIDSNVLNNTFVVEGPSNPNNEPTNHTNKTALQRSVSEIVEQAGGRSARSQSANNSSSFNSSNTSSSSGFVKSPRGNAWLQLTQPLDGHSKPILCLSSTEEVLVSGSKDGTCRVWDLESGSQIACYDGHPHNVSCVCHVPDLNLILTGSSYQVKIFDTRSNQPVKVLCSSGSSGSQVPPPQPPIPSLPQSTTLPRVNDLPFGEKLVHSIQAVRNYFYTSFGERIRIWDLRKMSSLGILAGKHNASVMCITGAASGLHDSEWVISGSKDHTIKVYEYERDALPEQITSIHNLNPPHYDGIECLLLGDKSGALYSGSRDTCIKKWDLDNLKMVSTVTNAHSGWITGLTNVPTGTYDAGGNEYVLSSSRDGCIKVWDSTKEFREIARFENNQSLECVDSNSRFVFFGGSAGAGGNSIGCAQVNERLFTLLVQYRDYQQQHGTPRERSYSALLASTSRLSVSPSSSPKVRRKAAYFYNNVTGGHSLAANSSGSPHLHPHHPHHLQQHMFGSTENIMTRSTGGLTFLDF